ncbi:AAA family ATPase [Dethiosulfatarculus sandiegensis]|nr:cytidylate kinase-like family protein [Dethiosulfatarculus sandiegensis]
MAVISISRQFGAGGKTLGEAVALDLGYRFVHEGMLDKLACEMAESRPLAAGAEFYAQAHLTNVLSSLGPADYLDYYIKQDDRLLSQEQHLGALNQVIKELAEMDNIVLLGRGSQFILKGHPGALRILLVADQESRVDFLIRRYSVTPSKAQALLKRADKKRSRFLKLFFPTEPNETSLYHMVLNTTWLSLDMAKGLILDLVKRISSQGEAG